MKAVEAAFHISLNPDGEELLHPRLHRADAQLGPLLVARIQKADDRQRLLLQIRRLLGGSRREAFDAVYRRNQIGQQAFKPLAMAQPELRDQFLSGVDATPQVAGLLDELDVLGLG